jgi:hypothetical protein
MNQRTKIIIGAILGLALLLIVVIQLMPDSEHREYMANVRQGQSQDPQPPADPGAPAAPAAPAARPAPAAPQRAEVDIDALLASVREVEFDYNEASIRRDPMRPLVGRMSPAAFGEMTAAQMLPQQAQGLNLVARNMVVTGIVFDANRPLAIVNNEIVSRGTELSSGILVEDIEVNRVILRVNGTLIPLELEDL